MGLVREFKTSTSVPNEVSLYWKAPINFNNNNDEIIITKTSSHFPMELYNAAFPTKATDSRPVEIFRGNTIVGLNTGTISVLGNTITDTAASFLTNPPLKGRLLRDSDSKVLRIISNTSTSITLEESPANGKYIVLPDFQDTEYNQRNYEVDIRTSAGTGYIQDLVQIVNNSLQIIEFEEDSLANLIFRDGSGTKLVIKSNTKNVIYFFENSYTPNIGYGMTIFPSHTDSLPLPYKDIFKSDLEASTRNGSGLLDNTFYYYTAFNKEVATNVAQAEFATISSGISTQDFAISTKQRNFGEKLYNLWPKFHHVLDTTGDLQDLMQVFGFQFNEIHSLIDTYKLQDTDNVMHSVLPALSEQSGLPTVGYSIGADTLRRISREMIPCWKLKGSKEGIALFIRVITTWDITNGTGDFSAAISDYLPNVEALRFFDPNLGNTNTRLTKTDPFVSGGRFAKTLPGIVIPGFFTFREFVINIPNVALFIGASEGFSTASGTTTMTDTAQNYGAVNSLVGNFLIPNQEEVNDIFQIVGNTSNTITVKGIINNRVPGGEYSILSPLNINRFIILNKLLPYYIPYGTKAGFTFT